MYLGIEIGGTKLQLGVGSGDGIIPALWRVAIDPEAGAEGILRQIETGIPELMANARMTLVDLRGAGIGFGGPTDDVTQTVVKSHHVEGWYGFPLAKWLTNKTGLPAVICNDADTAGLAEAVLGAGVGHSPIFYITVGSGIGGGLIVDGKIYRGVGRGASEIGHLRVDNTGNILEHYASGWGIGARARERLQQENGTSSLAVALAGGRVADVTGKHVAEAAVRGDPLASVIMRQALEALARAIGEVIRLLCPKRVIIGGGVSLIGEERFFQPLRELVNREEFQAFAGLTEIVPAALAEEVVVHGALVLARQHFAK